jgi:hypothetical protein
MSSLNTAWKFLVYLGIFSLIAVIGWEVYQITTGGRAEFTLVVVEMPKSVLFTKNLEDHLNNDELNVVEVVVPEEEVGE